MAADQSFADALRDTAMLCDLTIRSWRSSKNDTHAVEDVRTANHATGNVGRFSKNVLANADNQLKAVHAAQQAARVAHYELTLPWVSNLANRASGSRLLPNQLYLKYLKAMSAHKQRMEAALDEFVAAYPDCVEKAKASLGKLASDADYPDPEDIRKKFSIEMEFNPIPTGAEFRGLPESVITKMQASLDARAHKRLANATTDVMERLVETATHLILQLEKENPRIRTSAVSNCVELAELVEAFNIAKDPKLTALATKLLDAANVDPDDLRRDKQFRKQVAEDIRAALGNWQPL